MRNVITSCRNNANYNISIVLAITLSYLPFLLGMQYSKHKWVITRPDTLWGYVPILHAETSLYVLVAAFVIWGMRSIWGVYIVLTFYYAVCFLDNIVWFAFMRPFHPKDVMRGIELIQYFREFATLNTIGLKNIVYMTVPLMTGIATLLCSSKNIPDTISRRISFLSEPTKKLHKTTWIGTSIAVAGYAISIPLVLSSSYLHNNTLIRMGEEIYYEQKITNTQMTPSDKIRLWGSASKTTGDSQITGYNVIFYVLETAPAGIYPDLASFFKQWTERNSAALISSSKHYTTYPESDRSFLSMMTGNYPSLNRGSSWIESYDYGKSLPKVLEQNGYRNYLFSTAPLGFHHNDIMVRNLGFSNAIDSSIAKEAYAQAQKKKETLNRSNLYSADQALLEQVLEVIKTQHNHPYLLAFLPQSSHAPFHAPPGYQGGNSQQELFDANARWQMGLIERIMKRLEDAGQAQKTILIVVGDHGLRHPAESSLFRNQTMLSPLTFGVAFACYYPKQLPQIQQTATSHIDITPTVLEMLGIPYNSEDYQGRSMFKPTSRTVFFLGGDYLPVNGFTRNGWYYMENRNRDLILKSPEFNFDSAAATNIVAIKDNQERASVNRDLYLLKGLLMH